MLDRELKKGSAELLILSLVEHQPRHGYELSKLIDSRFHGAIRFHVASLYPLLYRLKKRGWIKGPWGKKGGQGQRATTGLLPKGPKVCGPPPDWREFWPGFPGSGREIA